MMQVKQSLVAMFVGGVLGAWITFVAIRIADVRSPACVPVDIFRSALLGCAQRPSVCDAAVQLYFPERPEPE